MLVSKLNFISPRKRQYWTYKRMNEIRMILKGSLITLVDVEQNKVCELTDIVSYQSGSTSKGIA